MASHCIAVSQGVADSVSRVLGVPDEKVTAIYNPVVIDKIARRSAVAPTHPWFADGWAPIVLAAGRLVMQKDFSTLLRAFSRLSKERPCRLIILGEGKKRPHLEALVRTLELQGRVSLPDGSTIPTRLCLVQPCLSCPQDMKDCQRCCWRRWRAGVLA